MYEFPEQKGVSLYDAKRLRIFIGFMAAISLSACTAMNSCPGCSPAEQAAKRIPQSSLSDFQKNKFEKVQKYISTNKDFLYHDAVVEPKVFEAPYPFYLLGFEKPGDTDSLKPYCKSNDSCDTPKFDPQKFQGGQNDDVGEIKDTQKDIEDRLFGDKRPLVLTHVLKVKNISDMQGSDRDSCFIFNVYGEITDTPWCQNSHKVNILKNDVLKPDWKREGWKGLDQIAVDIKATIDTTKEKPTHIILLATGWNTRQYESYLDFKAWMDNITEDFKKKQVKFRPIFIGTSWQSEWPWWNNIPFISVFNKGNDADEIGFTWENYLLNDLIKPIAKSSDVQLVVIGHSFGSRIALGAHYERDILIRNEPVTEAPLTIIAMQAAFPIARFGSTEGKEHQYVEANKDSANVVITSSEYDKANNKMCIGTAYVGAGCGLDKLKKEDMYNNFVTVLDTYENGEPKTHPDIRRISVYDASPFVKCQLKGTASGAHSDVYDNEMGHFLGEIIRDSTSGK